MENYGYLIHSAKGTTWAKGGHKYLWKEKRNGKWYYFYRSSNKNYGYDGMSTKGYLPAIDDAYKHLEQSKKELTDSKKDQRTKREINQDMMKVAKDRRRYLEENRYHKFRNDVTKTFSKTKSYVKSFPERMYEKQKTGGENWNKLIDKHKRK